MRSKAETIFDELKQEMKEINTALAELTEYDKSPPDSSALEIEYKKLQDRIIDFGNKLRKDAFSDVNSEEMAETKEQVYGWLFSSKNIDPVELLCFSKKLDFDQLLVCARRAQFNKDDRRFLFICDLDFIKEELWQNKIPVDNVTNFGILHHYSKGMTFEVNSENKAINVSNGDPDSITAVTQVFDVIPNFIKDNMKTRDLKVVLRSCSSAAVEQDLFELHPKTIAYPIKLLPPSLDISPMIMAEYKKKSAEKSVEKLPKNPTGASVAQANTPAPQKNNPTAQVNKPVTKKSNPAAQGSNPAAQGSNPVAQGSNPVAQGSNPVAQGSNPAAQAKNQSSKTDKKTPKTPPIKTMAQIEEINAYRKEKFESARKINQLDNKIAGNICISQDIVGDELTTLLYLPFDKEPILLKEFPALITSDDFKKFADLLIEYLLSYKGDLHINPMDISLIIEEKNYSPSAKAIILNGLLQFKGEFILPKNTKLKDLQDFPLLKQWESKVSLPFKDEDRPEKSDKVAHRKLLSSANDVKDLVTLPEETYAKKLLTSIKDTCPNVKVFKCYYGGYRAAPDRMVREMAKGDASHPKGIIVSRSTFWGEKKPEAPETPEASSENKQNPTGSF